MDRELLREGDVKVEVSRELTGTGPRLRIRASDGATVALDPLELEGLTRLPFTSFPDLEGDLGEDDPNAPLVDDAEDAGQTHAFGGARESEVMRNEFAMVAVSVDEASDGVRLRVRNMASGAEVRLRPGQLERLTRLRHRDLAPLVDPSGLSAEPEPDPDQV